MNVLVIENIRLYQELMAKFFSAHQIEAVLVGDAAAGLDKIGTQTFDVVCIARELPDMSGLDLLPKIRSHDSHAHVTSILISDDAEEQSLRAGLDAGFTDVLDKSNLDNIAHTVDRLVEGFLSTLDGKVLYLEDSASVAAMTQVLLEEMGLQVDHFVSGEQGLNAFDDNDYDLVVSDVVLEGEISGVGIVNHIRKSDTDKARIPILTMSGTSDTARRVELLRMGANDYVNKPIQQEEFQARVSNLVQAKQLFDQVQEQQRKLQEMATTDQLTGLFNRHSLSKFGPKYISEAYRQGTNLSVMVIDLDHFKSINDTHGHTTGDAVLRAVGGLLLTNCRNEDMAVRFGGEEFLVLLGHCGLEDALRKAEQLRAIVEALRPEGLTVTASIGVAALPTLIPDVDFDDLFKAADKAVYDAKHGGRNQVCPYTGEFKSTPTIQH